MPVLENIALLLDLTEWVARQPRAYDEVMAAWRTSCPRLTIWEDALDGGLVSVSSEPSSGKTVSVTAAGLELLRRHDRGK